MATHYSAVAVTFVLSLIIIGFIVFMQPRNNKFDAKVVRAVGDGVNDDSLALSLIDAWNATCHSTTGLFKLSTGNSQVGPLTFTGPCIAKKMVVNVVGNVIAQPKNAWPNNSDTWIKFTNVHNLVITGTGTFDGQGSGWWNCDKVIGLAFHNCNGLFLNGLTSVNSPRNHVSINACNGATISNINIRAPWDSPNTDGIDISDSNGVNVIGGHIGTGDDCIAINGGSYNINITSLNCGPGHGISVGSLGRNGANDVVKNIRVIGATFTDTQNGVRIKTVPGGSGSASQITFSGITMTRVQHPIILTQFYCPHKSCTKDILPVVQINGVSFLDIHGTSATPDAISISCSAHPKSCVGITLGKINIQPVNPSMKLVTTCKNVYARFILGPVVPRVVCTPPPPTLTDHNYKDHNQHAIATS
ncbi:hypothetical protein R6Q59_021722 [Mikania micrantha]